MVWSNINSLGRLRSNGCIPSLLWGRVLSYGMDDSQQDQHEERLKEVFDSFDTSGVGSLCPEELSKLCQALQLDDATPTLVNALLQNQDTPTARVDFEQFKTALILVLSTTLATGPPPCQETTCAAPPPDSPEVQAKFVRGSKRYGRRSTPEYIENLTDSSAVGISDGAGQDSEGPTVPRKRERWNSNDSSTEEYEAEGQLHLWNPDDPSTPRGSVIPLSSPRGSVIPLSSPRGSVIPLSSCLEERLRQACEDLSLPWEGGASHQELLSLCDHLGLEVTADLLQFLPGDEMMSVQVFVSWFVNHAKPPTPSASTPYRQLKRLHSSQPFDETGRRTSVFSSTIGMRLFSTLDDGSGFTPAEYILDAWLEEGIDNSPDILQALEFDLEGKVNLRELTSALENELLITKSGVHQAALVSFKAEIRSLLEQVDRERREKEKLRSDLEKAERLKTQLATEMDEHHSAIERVNDLNLRQLEEEHREKLASVRSDLLKEMDQLQQQSGRQREELEAELEKIRDDETFLREHLSLTVKESKRLEEELLDSTERLVEAENQVAKLQRSLDNIIKEKFGDLDPGNAEFFLTEERLRQLRCSYEGQCRELQDRIDELQAELNEFHSLGRTSQLGVKASLSEEMESKSPGMESDPGIGSEEGQPLFSVSLETEMFLEQMKDKHIREMEDLQAQLESKVIELEQKVKDHKADLEGQKAMLSLQYRDEIQTIQEQMSSSQHQALVLQTQLEHVKEERDGLDLRWSEEREVLEQRLEKEVSNLSRKLLEAQSHSADLEEQLRALEGQRSEMEELSKLHTLELNALEEQHQQLLHTRMEEERQKQDEEKAEMERRLLGEGEREKAELEEEWEREKTALQQKHEEEVKLRIEEQSVRFQAEREELEMRLEEEWEREKAELEEEWEREKAGIEEEWKREKAELEESKREKAELEEEMLRLVKEQNVKEARLSEQWDLERAHLQHRQEEVVLTRLAEERLRQQEQRGELERMLREEWEGERRQLEEDCGEVIRERIREERERLVEEKEELEKRLGQVMDEEKEGLEEAHRRAMQELVAKHTEERGQLSTLLDKLQEEISEQRNEASRLAEENLLLRNKISTTVKKEEQQQTQQEQILKLQNLKKEKISAQKMAERFKRQISELRHRSQQLEDENGLLLEKNAQNAAGMEGLNQKLVELLQQNSRQETVRDQQLSVSEEDRAKMAVCVSALESELTSAVQSSALVEESRAQVMLQLNTFKDQVSNMGALEYQMSLLLQDNQALEKQTQGLRSQLARSQDRTKVLDESLRSVNLQTARLKSDIRLSHQEKEALKQEVMSLHKQLQNANDRNQVLEVELHSTGYHSQHKKRYREELARLMEEQQHQLRQENERLILELHNAQAQLEHSRDMTCQLEATILAQKQQCQSTVVKTLEQEKNVLRKELDRLHQELLAAQSKQVCEVGEVHRELDCLRQENEGLKTQQARLQARLVEALQDQLGGLLPPSPRRMPGERRGHHRGDDHHPENIQEERAMVMMMKMEERMKEIELSLHNVKLLLKEKVSQLKVQLQKNSNADALIKDLYVENAQLLKALEMTEQRHKVAEKKNYLLEEKIFTLNKIVRDLNPSPYHYTCS
ncbi:hypothetical protein UPYG_G00227100 [Umbra pygmaea]|uniref:EF-hand domain-containing protein n=1 Tax=Umbra pygmaea TaxID=75934 RepID=A0ABD0WHH8_UMBPY